MEYSASTNALILRLNTSSFMERGARAGHQLSLSKGYRVRIRARVRVRARARARVRVRDRFRVRGRVNGHARETSPTSARARAGSKGRPLKWPASHGAAKSRPSAPG